jgi:hypothetical protein
MDKLKISTANLVILVAGAVMLIASFLAFHKISVPSFEVGGQTLGGGTKSYNAWSTGHFFIATIPALLGVVMALHVALETYAPQVSLPDRVLGFTWTQVHLVLALQATIMMLAFLIQNFSPLDRGIGLYLMLIAAIALLVGAVMRMQEKPGGSSYG